MVRTLVVVFVGSFMLSPYCLGILSPRRHTQDDMLVAPPPARSPVAAFIRSFTMPPYYLGKL
jgi:hypothetical protein